MSAVPLFLLAHPLLGFEEQIAVLPQALGQGFIFTVRAIGG